MENCGTESSAATLSYDSKSHETRTSNSHITANPTAARVLANYELVENILSNLPFKDLVQAQQVNTDFANVVDRSKRLRTILFQERGKYEVANQDDEPFHPNFFDPDLTLQSAAFSGRFAVPLEKPNPFLVAGGFSATNRFWIRRTYDDEFSDLAWEFVERMLTSRGQSWETMYATQPPTCLVYMWIFEYPRSDKVGVLGSVRWQDCTRVRNPAGVRLGEIADAIQASLESGGNGNSQKRAEDVKNTQFAIELSVHNK